MPVQFVCPCGKELRIPDEHAGRRIMCPACGASHVAPGPDPAGDVRPATPGQARPARRKIPLLLPLVLLLVLLAAGAGAYWWFFRGSAGPEAEGDDLALVPPEAEAFISVRLADLWNTPAAMKAVLKMEEGDPGQKMEEVTGLRPLEVERLTVVVMDSKRRIGWAAVRTRALYDRTKLLKPLQGPTERVHREMRYFLGTATDGEPRAIWFVGSRVVVVGSEEGVRLCLDFAARGSAAGPLTPMIEQARGTHTAVAGLCPKGRPDKKANKIPVLGELLEAKRITATLDVNENAVLEGKATMASETAAKELVRTINNNRFQITLALAGLAAFGGDKAKVLAPLLELFGKTKFSSKGDEATATAKIDGERAAEMLLELPGAVK